MTNDQFKSYRHNPPHLFVDDAYYMITAAVYEKRPFLSDDWTKRYLFDVIQSFCREFDWKLLDWVILDNHYHLILKSHIGKDLSRLMGGIHRKSANQIKKRFGYRCKRFWWNYWDMCPRSESQLYAMQNYVHYNPVKHNMVEDLKMYPWSSFPERYELLGRKTIMNQFQKYDLSQVRIRDDF